MALEEGVVTNADLCARCGHDKSEHGTEESFYQGGGESQKEVCLSCVGWPETGDTPRRGSKARHRFVADTRSDTP